MPIKNQTSPQVASLQSRFKQRLMDAATDSKQLDLLLNEELSFWQILFNQSRDGIVIMDIEGSVLEANHAFANMLGYCRDEVYAMHVWDWDADMSKDEILSVLKLVSGEGADIETRHRRKDGVIINVEVSTNSTHYNGEKILFCICRNVTKRLLQEQQLQALVSTDALTGLQNRREFNYQLNKALKLAQYEHAHCAVILFDIDHFKHINDRFGHAAGDHVLIKLAQHVRANLRATDNVCRWGGEEFIILLKDSSIDKARMVAESLRKRIEKIKFVHGQRVTASFGVSGFQQGDDAKKLIGRADRAMYAAKGAGRNQVHES